jgi:hypothetical protein
MNLCFPLKEISLMKKLITFCSILFASPTFAAPDQVYRPFRYETPCILEQGIQTYPDMCVVIETREKGGALRTRNIYSNKHSLTIRGRFDKEKGYMTWDSHNKFEYKWDYKVGGTDGTDGLGAWTYVMPGFLVQNVSWD